MKITFVIPRADYTGGDRVVLEAMAYRTPVIGTPVGAAPELLAGGGGILVNPRDPTDRARAIVPLCRLPWDWWGNLSEMAYATAMQHTCDRATLLFEAALQTAIERRSRDLTATAARARIQSEQKTLHTRQLHDTAPDRL